MVNTKYNVCKASAVSISNGFQKTNFPEKPAQKGVIYVATAEKAMAPHSSTLAWKIPWAEEPGRLQSMGSRRVGHN